MHIQRFALLVSACSLLTLAQNTVPAGTPARITVSVGHLFSREAPVLTVDNLTVTEDYDPLPVTRVTPLRAEPLEMFLLVDNCSNFQPGTSFDDLRKFINSQPATAGVGVAYIQEGRLHVAQSPTLAHAAAVKGLNTPATCTPASPFVALTDLINQWKRDSSRRVVVMISNGLDPGVTVRQENPSAEAALTAAQLAGVTVYAIYHPSADYLKTDSSQVYAGQVQLAHVADETGGEAYFLGFGPLPAIAPFLSDISDHLTNQYRVEFLANPNDGGLHEISIKSKLHDIDLMAPAKVWIPGRDTSEEK